MRKSTAALLLAGMCVVAAACGTDAGQNIATPTSTTPAPTPVAVGALKGLLLSPRQLNSAVGATKLAVKTERTYMWDNDATVSEQNCRAVQEPAAAAAYADSQWIAVQGNVVEEAGDAWTHLVDQAVVAFVSAKDAAAFFTTATQRWQACSDGHYTVTRSGRPAQEWTVGPVADTDGTLSATLTSETKDGGCQRVLTVANNVAIDVDVCSADPGGAAVNITHQIAAKVPTK
jgi:serine/threonine-protein kinase